jgi:glycerol-3-phosphate dehydrogenase
MIDQLDCVIVGAGVVGLAIGRSLANAGRDVVVLETEPEIGMHTSSRNSEVIHAGIYYEQDSLKAQLCVSGKHMLYDYCEARHVPFQRSGSWVFRQLQKRTASRICGFLIGMRSCSSNQPSLGVSHYSHHRPGLSTRIP